VLLAKTEKEHANKKREILGTFQPNCVGFSHHPTICPELCASFRMRLLLAAASTLLFLVSPAFCVADFSGKWVLDLRASSSPHAILKRLGASWVERRFGGSIQMEATYTQTPQLLTVDHRGFGFQKTDVIRIDNKPEIQQDSLLGRYTIRTFWSENGMQLISVISFHTIGFAGCPIDHRSRTG